MLKSKTAILLFSRTLEDEFKAKSFDLNQHRFRQFYWSLLNKTRFTIKSVDAPVFEIDSSQQTGSTFGERLTNAIRTVAAEGYENVVVIGNDAPSLNTQILQRAISQLESGHHVLGRDEHGGCYLIGLRTADTDFDQFRDIAWQTRAVFEEVNAVLGAVTELPLLTDLNNKEDLNSQLFQSTLAKSILLSLKALLFGVAQHIAIIPAPVAISSARTFDLRGPPSL